MDDEVTEEEFPSSRRRLSFGDFFKEWFPFYLNCGMTRDEYWNQDSSLVVYYFRAYTLSRDEKNYFAWLQGAYNFTAFSAALTNFGMGLAGKHGNPEEYPHEPTPIRAKTEEELEAEADEQRRKIVASLNRFHAMMEAKNAGQQAECN